VTTGLGAPAPVEAVERFAVDVTVYNLEVSDFHTYFIGHAWRAPSGTATSTNSALTAWPSRPARTTPRGRSKRRRSRQLTAGWQATHPSRGLENPNVLAGSVCDERPPRGWRAQTPPADAAANGGVRSGATVAARSAAVAEGTGTW
jgi:hypothetical protein